MATIAETLAQAQQHQQAGNYVQMEQVCRRALELHADAADLYNLLGASLALQGRYAEAAAALRDVLRLAPDSAEAWSNLGIMLRHLGQLAQAEACFRDAVRLRPDLPEPHNNLGLVLAAQGRTAQAMACYEVALRLRPDYFEALVHLGDVLQQMGRPVEAEARYRHGLRLRSDRAAVHNNLGIVLAAQGRFAEAEASYREALRLAPNFPQAVYNLGIALEKQGRPDEALASYEQAVRMKPDYADALNNLGYSYQQQGRLDEALACYRQGLATEPWHPVLQSNLLFALQYHAGYDPEVSFAEHLRWARQFGQVAPEHQPLSPIDRDPGRRLRIGYVSGDFREHVQGRYSEAFISAHDHSQFEIFCYANVRQEDERTRRIKAAADHWRSIVGLTDEQAADQIRQDRIDLLIDQSGLTRDHRLAVFARKPAPIQASSFGYAASTGLAAIDYRITDAYCDPPGMTERFHREKLVRLPDLQWCYAPGPCPEVEPGPAQRAGEVTFASFNNLIKVTEEMIGIWGQVLRVLPASRMLVLTGAGSAGDARVLAAFGRHGIEPPRVTLLGKQPREAYFRLYHDVDICLDTFPFCGGNVTADALWMGVPVVTLAGKSWPSRQGVGMLIQAGLEDLVTQSPAAFVEAATRLAHDLPRLADLRAQLRDRVKRTLGDVEGFTRQLEAAYRQMWHAYCAASR